MEKATLRKFCSFFTAYELIIGQIAESLKPESADIAIKCLNIVKDLPSPLVFILLRKGQKLKST
jgi:hypothetical protein